jgi:hypothetical protein
MRPVIPSKLSFDISNVGQKLLTFDFDISVSLSYLLSTYHPAFQFGNNSVIIFVLILPMPVISSPYQNNPWTALAHGVQRVGPFCKRVIRKRRVSYLRLLI